MGLYEINAVFSLPYQRCATGNTDTFHSHLKRMQNFLRNIHFIPANMSRGHLASPLNQSPSSGATSSTKTIDVEGFLQAHNGGESTILVSPTLKFDKLPQCKLAVKILRNVETNCPETVVRCQSVLDALHFLRELEHPNVSLVWINDVVMKGMLVPALTIPIYENGDIQSFLRRNPNVNRLTLVQDIARGLAYLHLKGVTHGNLCPNNILIKDNRRACITDIGLDALSEMHLHPGRVAPPSQWLFKSPEELEKGLRGMPQDVYAFASTIYITLNGKMPVVVDPAACLRGLRYVIGQAIEVPWEGVISAVVWALMQRCWEYEYAERPKMEEIEAELSGISNSSE